MISKMQEELEDERTRSPSDFSIEHILKRAGETSNRNRDERQVGGFTWLQCTRFCPPKIPRNVKKIGPQKRQLGRYPRIPFTSQQLAVLEEKFQQNPYLSSEEATELSQRLQLADVKVKIWFQNRRARKRRETLAEFRKSEKNEKKKGDEESERTEESRREVAGSSGYVQSVVPVPFVYLNADIRNFPST